MLIPIFEDKDRTPLQNLSHVLLTIPPNGLVTDSFVRLGHGLLLVLDESLLAGTCGKGWQLEVQKAEAA